jgi:hypothetical protein
MSHGQVVKNRPGSPAGARPTAESRPAGMGAWCSFLVAAAVLPTAADTRIEPRTVPLFIRGAAYRWLAR